MKSITNRYHTLKFSEQQKSSLAQMIATRQNSAEFYAALMSFLPDPDPVLAKNGRDIKVYKELMLDPHVYSCLEQRKAKVLSMEWELNLGESSGNGVAIIEQLFRNENFNLTGIIETMLDAVAFGFQPMEIIWKNKNGYILPGKIEDKPAEWFIFDQENQPRFKSKEKPVEGEELPPKKFLFAQNKPSYNNPYGEKVLSRCFWPVTFKKTSEKWWISFLEKYGMVWAIGKLPRNLMGDGSQEQNKLLDLLDALVNDAVGIIPDDSSVDFKEASGKDASAGMFRERAEYSNTEISKAILTQTLTTEIGDKGSYAASATHADMLTHLALKDKRIIEREINRLIRWIYELNFSEAVPPKFTMYLPEDVDKQLAERDKILKEIGVNFNKSYFVKNYNMGKEEFEISVGQPV
jgi:phage gp29-like protein